MKKFTQFLKKHKYKLLLILTLFLIFIIPKLRVLFNKKQGKKIVNPDGTKPIEQDYEVVNDSYKQADIIAHAIYQILHLENVPVLDGYYDHNHANFIIPDYSQIISLLNTNKSIITEIQERYTHHYKRDFITCFPYHTKTSSINILYNTFKDVKNFTIITVPTRGTALVLGIYKDFNITYDTTNWTLGVYFKNYYSQLQGMDVPTKYKAY